MESEKFIEYSQLKKERNKFFFCAPFQVIANGIQTEETPDSYYGYLNAFRAKIKIIHYILKTFVVDEFNVVIPFTAKVEREYSSHQTFEVILILRFNQKGKIILFHEVYVEI